MVTRDLWLKTILALGLSPRAQVVFNHKFHGDHDRTSYLIGRAGYYGYHDNNQKYY